MNPASVAQETMSFDETSRYMRILFHHDLDMEIMLGIRPHIERQLISVTKPIIVDLEKVHFLDSAAVGVLAMIFRHAKAKHLSFVLCAVQPQPEAVLGMVGLSDHVKLYPSLREAEQAVLAA